MQSQPFYIFVLVAVAIIVYLVLRKLPGSKNGTPSETEDPIAGTDFRMAYGKYKDAKTHVEAALEIEPSRIDLKMKLLEVCFVWGNESEFSTAARKYEGDLRDADEWDKVEMMGKQVAPNEFS